MGRLFCLSLFSTKPRASKGMVTIEISKNMNARVLSAADGENALFNLQGSKSEIPKEAFLIDIKDKNEVYAKNEALGPPENLFSCSQSSENECSDAAFVSPSEQGTSCNCDRFPEKDGVFQGDAGREAFGNVLGQLVQRDGFEVDSKNGETLNLNSFCIPDSYMKGEYIKQSSVTSQNESLSSVSDGKSSIVLQFSTSEKGVIEAGNVLAKDGVEMKAHPCSEETGFNVVQPLDTRVKEWMHQSEFVDVWEEENAVNDFNTDIYSSDDLELTKGSNQDIYPKAAEEIFMQERVGSLRGSKTAHLSAISLRGTPSLGTFSSLRTIDLSRNLIVRISAGCFPRRLHTLNLSRNRISQIEGLRELTHLRILDLSHNRLVRIGHGLSNCTHIKELYLGGNKIGEVEGLHRLLKLVVLDLNNNKLDSTESINQLAANYGSLMALDLLGNPILRNVENEQLLKFLGMLTPHVAYLNRQAIKAVSARDLVLAHVARAALGTQRNRSRC